MEANSSNAAISDIGVTVNGEVEISSSVGSLLPHLK